MKKTRLDIGALQVDSFAVTDEATAPRGTVHGHGPSGVPTCNCPTQAGCAYPTNSCGPTETYGENTCFCLYEPTHFRVCCDGTVESGGGMC